MQAKSTENNKKIACYMYKLKEDKNYLTTGQRQHHVLEISDW